MKSTNALKMRQNLGRVLDALYVEGEPISVERRGKPVAVLITWEEYKKRFVDQEADKERKKIVENILASNLKAKKSQKTLDILHAARHK
jgi:prevent-host-death family protein